jgi:hypothetical protein
MQVSRPANPKFWLGVSPHFGVFLGGQRVFSYRGRWWLNVLIMTFYWKFIQKKIFRSGAILRQKVTEFCIFLFFEINFFCLKSYYHTVGRNFGKKSYKYAKIVLVGRPEWVTIYINISAKESSRSDWGSNPRPTATPPSTTNALTLWARSPFLKKNGSLDSGIQACWHFSFQFRRCPTS